MSFNLSCYVGQLNTSGALGHDVDLVVGGGQPLCAQLLEGEGGLAGDYSEFGIFTFDCLLILISIVLKSKREAVLAITQNLESLALDCLFISILVRTGNYFHL